MKKKIMVLLIAIMVFCLFLAGCSNDEQNTEKETNTEVAKTEKTSDEKEEKTPDKEVDKVAGANADEVNKTVAALEESFPNIDVNIEVIEQAIEATDTSMVIEIDTQSDEYIMDSLGDVLKYEVSGLDYEGYENEVYNLSYFSEVYWEDIAVYFYTLLEGTANSTGGLYGPEMGIGAIFKGTLFGLTTVVTIDYDEDVNETYVVIFCRPQSW